MCFDFLEVPNLHAIIFPAEESVLTVILTSWDRIADLNSWMKRSIRGWNLRLHDEDEVSCLIDILEKMLEIVEV